MSRLPPAPNVALGGFAQTTPSPNISRTASQINSDTGRPFLGPRSNSSSSTSSSGSSHSSHSSHIEREREAHLGEAADEKPGVAKPISSAIAILLYIFVLQAIALWLFTRGFLLTRTTLEDVTSCSKVAQTKWTLPRPISEEALLNFEEMAAWEAAMELDAECSLPPVYSRSVIWIIDALRYDFIADATTNPNGSDWSPNQNYHNIFKTPFQTHHNKGTSFSFLSHSVADAPTTTLQRLKGLTTGSLPTFIDAGSNFGGSAITEDNWLSQFKRKSLKEGKAGMGFAGDDTWMTVFPSVFDETWSWPYDSFNVEDLDSVDRGVEARLGAFLSKNASVDLHDWRLLVVHMLGVDHVGHRLGASHKRMKNKLEEMDEFMKAVLKDLPEDALLILLGDHGMDEHGDHGGDGELQTGSALWMYSRKALPGGGIDSIVLQKIVDLSHKIHPSYLEFSPLPSPPFPTRGHRSIPQIDFVPTISLLLGLPIPFNNLGSVIPEAFGSTDLLLRAMRINSRQIHRYLGQYLKASKDLQPFKSELDAAWRNALQKDVEYARVYHGMSWKGNRQEEVLAAFEAYLQYNRLSLLRAKSIWAQFEMNKMISGLALLLTTLVTCFSIKSAATDFDDASTLLIQLYRKTNFGTALGASIVISAKLASLYLTTLPIMQSFSILESASIGVVAGSQISLFSSFGLPFKTHSVNNILGISLPLLHALAFSSNSFTFDEASLILTLTIAAFAYRGIQGYLSSPIPRLKIRLPFFAISAMVALRLSSMIKVCRIEQGPECKATFYTGSDGNLNGISSIAIAYLCALAIPTMVSRALNSSRSYAGVAPLFLNWMLRPALLMGAGYWLVDWAFTAHLLAIKDGTSAHALLLWAKYALARFQLALVCIVCFSFWIFSPLCLELTKENIEMESAQQRQSSTPIPASTQRVVVLGFANSFGSSYILLMTLIFALLFLVAQPSGQIALTLILVAVFCCAELGDGERDIALLALHPRSSADQRDFAPASAVGSLPLSFLETSMLALIGFIAFFSTGHQATFESIQWRSAFIGFETVKYPFSPLLVIINSFAPMALLPSMSVALLVLYNLAPRPRAAPNSVQKTEKMPVIMHTLQASLSFLLYHLFITTSTAIFAAHFRRHLMLFNIWTPRFMLGVASLQITFIGLILGLMAIGNILSKVSVTFGSHF